jgi:hypothetical protein
MDGAVVGRREWVGGRLGRSDGLAGGPCVGGADGALDGRVERAATGVRVGAALRSGPVEGRGLGGALSGRMCRGQG